MGSHSVLPTSNSPLGSLLAAVRSVITYIVVSLYVLIAGPIALAVGVGLKNKTALYVPGHIGVALALGLAGIRYRVRGREHVPRGRPVVLHDRRRIVAWAAVSARAGVLRMRLTASSTSSRWYSC